MKKWEYYRTYSSGIDEHKRLGLAGLELCGVEMHDLYIFKREIHES